jgi:hypothetical protein
VPTFTHTTPLTQRLYLAPDSHPSNPRESSRGTRDHDQSHSRSRKPTAAVIGRAWWRLRVLFGGGGSGMCLYVSTHLQLLDFFFQVGLVLLLLIRVGSALNLVGRASNHTWQSHQHTLSRKAKRRRACHKGLRACTLRSLLAYITVVCVQDFSPQRGDEAIGVGLTQRMCECPGVGGCTSGDRSAHDCSQPRGRRLHPHVETATPTVQLRCGGC